MDSGGDLRLNITQNEFKIERLYREVIEMLKFSQIHIINRWRDDGRLLWIDSKRL